MSARLRWSDRWRGLVDDAGPATALRVSRGRAYERSGRVSDLRARPGALSARVQGSRATPYLVEVGLPVLDAAEWDRVVAAVVEQARHSARLLAGQAPEGLEDELAAQGPQGGPQGVRLFPHPAELATSCACDDPSPTCKHVVAVVEAAANRLDDDPFLLLHLRGRGRERFLADLTAARRAAGPEPEGISVSALSTERWTSASVPPQAVTSPAAADREAAAGQEDPLARRGDPPGWSGGVSAPDVFGPLADRGAAWARRLLDAEQPAPR